jgi:hypothetical protein
VKTTTTYRPYIAYSKGKWYPIQRCFDNIDKALRCIEEIRKLHKPTAKIALVTQTIEIDTIKLVRGTKPLDEPKVTQYLKCIECGSNRFRKNINPNTGVCLTCEMKKATI